MVRRRYLSTRALETGMVIDQSIIDRTGRILIGKKTVLDDFLIDALQKIGITGIYIREGEEDPAELDFVIEPKTMETIEKLKETDRAKVDLSESVKARVSEGIKFIYTDTSSPNFTNAAEDVTDNLMQTILKNDAVALNIDALKVSDEYTFKHSVDVATISMLVAKQCSMAERDIHMIGMAGLLHDVGKSMIPGEVLNKTGKLSEEEFNVMKNHALFGYQILKEKDDIPREVIMAVLQHHEKLNGKGYPLGLTEGQISSYAKILAVADIYDALVTERPYKKAFSQQDALEIIMTKTDELDITFMRSFFDVVILYPVDSIVTLSNGEKARVVKNTPHYPLRPKVVGLKTGKVYDLFGDLGCASLIIE